MTEKPKRDFKGIWIPKEIWLDQNLKIMEKIFIVEIDSLDNKDGCFASNSYFAKFFGITPQRCSQIINSLLKKGLIEATYYRDGKQIVKRVLNILTTYQGNVKKVLNKSEQPIKKSLTTYKGNVKDNNTSNNTKSNTINNTYQDRFNKLWLYYPKNKNNVRGDKVKSYDRFKKQCKTEDDFNNFETALNNYKESKTVKDGYVKNAENFFKDGFWQEYVDIDIKPQNKEITPEEFEKYQDRFKSKSEVTK